jgi:excisionase family DNA binding protein
VSEVPSHILDAVNALLAPFGEKFTPGAAGTPVTTDGKGYMNWKQASCYTGLSVSTLQRAARNGHITIHKLHPGKTGSVLIAVRDLDAYIQGR